MLSENRFNPTHNLLPIRSQLLILLLLPLFAPTPGAQSTSAPLGGVFYVANDGDDATGDGSLANPWATITHALDNLPPGSELLVRPGVYNGRVRLRGAFSPAVTVRSEIPYLAVLQNDDRVITAYSAPGGVSGITVEGFEIRHSAPGAAPLVVHIDGGGDHVDGVSNITLRNNVLHDSYNNDILKINNAARDILISGNLFYNQTGSDEHIDVNSVENVTVQDNIFFNDFAGSGRTNNNDTGSYIVIKDSNAADDSYLGSSNITVRRNVFLNWQGSTGANSLLIGEDAQPFIEARQILVENNLMLGNAANVMRAPFGVKSGEDVTFRHNTIVGDLPALAYAMRLNVENPAVMNQNINFYNNVWSDPTGTMGAENSGHPNDFSDTPPGETSAFVLANNLYWNGDEPIPHDPAELVNYTDDPTPHVANPLLASQTGLILPRWNPATQQFGDGASTIRQAFEHLVTLYGLPAPGGPTFDTARPDQSPAEDIFGNLRTIPDLGAVEHSPFTPSNNLFLPLLRRS